MGVYTDNLPREVRLEYMRPEQLDAAKRANPSIYLPVGSVEWHGYHNPVGLDAVKAHEMLVGLALRHGGVVYPAIFFGAGGGHLEYPHSFMVNPEPMVQLLLGLLARFEQDGYQAAILLSGHYPNHTEYQLPAVEQYIAAGGQMAVLSVVENQLPGVNGDHASLYETSAMLHLHPRTIKTENLVLENDQQPELGIQNWMDERLKSHPCYGLVGIDPRGQASAEIGTQMTEGVINGLAAWLRQNLSVKGINLPE